MIGDTSTDTSTIMPGKESTSGLEDEVETNNQFEERLTPKDAGTAAAPRDSKKKPFKITSFKDLKPFLLPLLVGLAAAGLAMYSACNMMTFLDSFGNAGPKVCLNMSRKFSIVLAKHVATFSTHRWALILINIFLFKYYIRIQHRKHKIKLPLPKICSTAVIRNWTGKPISEN